MFCHFEWLYLLQLAFLIISSILIFYPTHLFLQYTLNFFLWTCDFLPTDCQNCQRNISVSGQSEGRPHVVKRSIQSCESAFSDYCLNSGQCMFLVDINEHHCKYDAVAVCVCVSVSVRDQYWLAFRAFQLRERLLRPQVWEGGAGHAADSRGADCPDCFLCRPADCGSGWSSVPLL